MSASKRPPAGKKSVRPPKRDPNWEKEDFKTPAILFDVDEFASKHAPPKAAPKFSLQGTDLDQKEVTDLRGRFGRHDWDGALAVAQTILARSPSNVEAAYHVAQCKERLAALASFLEKHAALIPERSPETPLKRLKLDHRAGFLISLVDGHSTTEMILDISALPRDEAVRLLYGLLLDGAIQFR